MEELKRRLDVLLGEKPEAALDESRKAEVGKEAQTLRRANRVQTAGGQLLGAAFAFLGELFGESEDTEQSQQMAAGVKKRLSESLERSKDGSLQMTIRLPDEAALDDIAKSIARMVSFQQK